MIIHENELTTMERLKEEKTQLENRLRRLEKFIDESDIYANLSSIDKILLSNQLDTMIRYMEILNYRIERIMKHEY